MGAGSEAAFDWKSSGESLVTARDGEDCGERLNGDDLAGRGGSLAMLMKSEERSDTYAIVDSKPWKAGCLVEVDLGRWMEVEETLLLETGIETAWWTYGMGVGVDVYGRDEGDVDGKEAREGDETEGK